MTDIETDVLVLGGGPAGIWAALSAAASGAAVVLVDKARCAGSGPAAEGVHTLWNLPPGPGREEAVRRTLLHGGGLGDPTWMHRVLDETYRRTTELTRWGYRVPGARRSATPALAHLDGARYLRLLRRTLRLLGVRVLDRHPALHLLTDRDGVVAGAAGVRTGDRCRPWTARAGAVVLATGGCAFGSGAAGTAGATGEGLLMAAEAGARLSGMEFSCGYGLAVAAHPAGPVLRSARALQPALRSATLVDEDGAPLAGHRSAALAALADGRRVYALPAGLLVATRERLERLGLIDAAGRVPVRAVLEGTVRGTGGLRLTGADCATTVAGLYAAGDVADREQISGAVSGSGGHHAAWAIASGAWAGAAAAGYARGRGIPAAALPVPGAGLAARANLDPRAVVGLVQEHTLPLRRSYLRSADSLRDSIAELDALWPGARFELGGYGHGRVRAREAAALLAVARWADHTALARTESRGMHRRTDHPGAAPDWRVRLLVGGLDEIRVERERPPAARETGRGRGSTTPRSARVRGSSGPGLTPGGAVPL